MGDPAASNSSVSHDLQQIGSDLTANVSPSDLFTRLASLEPRLPDDQLVKALFLRVRGIVRNRLGLFKDALGDLYEAKTLLILAGDVAAEAEACREIARVFSWRGDSREAALALVEAFAIHDQSCSEGAIRLLIDVAALNFEIGRFNESKRWSVKASSLAIEGTDEKFRSLTILLQSLRALGQIEEAEHRLMGLDVSRASDRTHHLLDIESARLAAYRKDLPQAEARIAELRNRVSGDFDSFESIELCEVEADLAARRGRLEDSLALIRRVISRFAEDDLAGREVMARLKEAETLAELGRDDEEARTLLAALRRATSRNLVGHVGIVRARLGERKISMLSWMPGANLSTAIPSQDRFVRRRALGEGGIGTVSTAFDLETGELVALKRLNLADIYDQDVRQRRIESARKEAAAASRLQHPGIGRVYGFMVDENSDGLLVREMVVGPTLRDALAQPLPLDVKLTLLTELAQALAAVHAAGIVHRDMKPENIVLKGDRHPVIIDFGASSFGSTYLGGDYTALYAAPEQIASRNVDTRADIYAFGTIAFELLVGYRPERAKGGLLGLFGMKDYRNRLARALHAADCPPIVGQLIIRSIAERLGARPQAMQEFIVALQTRLDTG